MTNILRALRQEFVAVKNAKNRGTTTRYIALNRGRICKNCIIIAVKKAKIALSSSFYGKVVLFGSALSITRTYNDWSTL